MLYEKIVLPVDDIVFTTTKKFLHNFLLIIIYVCIYKMLNINLVLDAAQHLSTNL